MKKMIAYVSGSTEGINIPENQQTEFLGAFATGNPSAFTVEHNSEKITFRIGSVTHYKVKEEGVAIPVAGKVPEAAKKAQNYKPV